MGKQGIKQHNAGLEILDLALFGFWRFEGKCETYIDYMGYIEGGTG
jgi:hypothetical protein